MQSPGDLDVERGAALDGNDFLVAWQQHDYGRYGRPAECFAHAIVEMGVAQRVVYVQPQALRRRVPRHDAALDRGVQVHQVTGWPRLPPRQLARVVLRHSGVSEPVLLNCGVRPQNWHLHRAFAPHASRTVLVVHDRLDVRPGLSPAERVELARVRSRLLEGSDVVIGLSEGSIADVPGAHYVGHGCDESWRQPGLETLAEPEDLRDIPHPRAVYLGFLDERIEIGALEALAASGVHVVLVGPITPRATPELAARIASNPMLHSLGPRTTPELPAYLMRCDVGIAPHVDDAFTRSMEPHKLYNYAAAGLRCVTLGCTIPAPLSRITVTTSTASVFVEGVHQTLDAGPLDEATIRAYRSLTWSNVTQRILRILRIPTPTNGTAVRDEAP